MIRVLVAGAAGFIGSHLVEYLRQQRACDVTAIDIDTLDLASPGAAEALPRGVDYCFHFAGTMPTWKFYALPHNLLADDLRVTINLVEWAGRGHCDKLIFASSNEVYVGKEADEDADLHVGALVEPRTAYQLSKITSEALLINWARQMGFRATAVRLSNVYGPRMHEDQVVARFLRFAHERVDPFEIAGFDCRRQFLHVSDAVRILWELRDFDVPSVNIPGEAVNLRELADLVCGIVGYMPQFVETDPPPGAPRAKIMRTKYALPAREVPLHQGLRMLYESFYLAP